MKPRLVLCIMASLICTSASAATLDHVVGEVLVNQGKGFRPAHGTMPVATGDQVMADKAGSARIVCDSSASVDVTPGQVVTVSDCDVADLAPDHRFILLGGAAAVIGVGLITVLNNDHSASP